MSLLSLVASFLLFGVAGPLLVSPNLIIALGSIAISLAAIRVSGDPHGWRNGWFHHKFGHLGGSRYRNLVMARGWEDPEGLHVNSSLDAQVAALVTEVQFLREEIAHREL